MSSNFLISELGKSHKEKDNQRQQLHDVQMLELLDKDFKTGITTEPH